MKKLSLLVCMVCMMAVTSFAQDANQVSSSTQVVKSAVEQVGEVEASTSKEVMQARTDVKQVPAGTTGAAKSCCAKKASASAGSSCTAAQKAACTPEQKAACEAKKAAGCSGAKVAAKSSDTPN